MPEILYSKFSKDRQKKFQIATMIVAVSYTHLTLPTKFV